MKKILGLVLLGLCILDTIGLIYPNTIHAGTTADVTITASGIIVEAPGGFTITYINDFDVSLSWTKPLLAENTMVRASYSHVPVDRNDGYLVYYGTNSTYSDTAISLVSPDIVYYRAWSQKASGVWEEIGSTADTGGIMSASFLFIGLLILGAFLTWFNSREKNILLCFAASLVWFALAAWLFFGTSAILSLEETYTQLLAWVFAIMIFIPIVLHMNVEVRRDMRNPRGDLTSWIDHGSPPKDTKLSENEIRHNAYMAEYRRRVRKYR